MLQDLSGGLAITDWGMHTMQAIPQRLILKANQTMCTYKDASLDFY